jgi:alkylation response protein AidB-like acyl-CoA dehydrogenase
MEREPPDPASLTVATLLDDVEGLGAIDGLADRLRAGTERAAIAFAEPDAGSDIAASRLSAAREGDVWVLNGQKKYIVGGANAEHLLVLAKTDTDAPGDRGLTAFLLPRDAGVTSQTILDVLGRPAFDKVFLEDVRLPRSARLGDEGRGWLIGERAREAWLAPVTAQRLARLRAARSTSRVDDGGAARARTAEVATAVEVAAGLLDAGRTRQAHLVAVAAEQRAWRAGGGLAAGLRSVSGDGPVEHGVDAQAAGVAQAPLEVHRNALARDLGLP